MTHPDHAHPATPEEFLRRYQISLWLDTYEDIFSDFDPRPLGQRALSDDFLSEAKRAIRERKEGSFELHLLIPTTQRSPTTEAVVRKRLREHFTKHAARLAGERKSRIVRGALTACAGFGIIAIAASMPEGESFLRRIVSIILEPSGWFTMWFGFDTVFYGTKEIAQDATFYERMAHASIVFENC